jgi:hypothetical protein
MVPTLDGVPRDQLLGLAYDWMLSGMLVTRSMMPLVVLSGGDMDLMNEVAIDEWMGASPNYTRRLQRVFGIEGDDVTAIIKGLQLDVGFVHQYMHVVYQVIDWRHAEFYLRHCGALLDAEEFGEERVFGMCHTIEDPTFDATALATNPRAQIRPLHRPPRVPSDREPHCHWTIAIDPDNDPVPPIELTTRVGATALAGIENEVPQQGRGNGIDDYRGPLIPDFRLDCLSDAALLAATREFQIQAHLLMVSSDLALRDRFPLETVGQIMRDSSLGAGWVASERLNRSRGVARDRATPDDVAAALSLTPMLPPGCTRVVHTDGNRVHLELDSTVAGLLDPSHPGWTGVLAAGDASGIEGIVCGASPKARVDELVVSPGSVRASISADEAYPDRAEPDVVALAHIGRAPAWQFQLTPRAS